MEEIPGLVECINIPPVIVAIINSKLATYHELDTIYGVEAGYDLLEICLVNNHNERSYEKWQRLKN